IIGGMTGDQAFGPKVGATSRGPIQIVIVAEWLEAARGADGVHFLQGFHVRPNPTRPEGQNQKCNPRDVHTRHAGLLSVRFFPDAQSRKTPVIPLVCASSPQWANGHTLWNFVNPNLME